MFAREDLRRNTADVLKLADQGKIVSIGSRLSRQGELHILNDEQLMQLTAAQAELKRRDDEEASTVQGRLAARLRHALGLLQAVTASSSTSTYGKDPITPEGIARTLGLEATSSFEDLLRARVAAPFPLLRKFADRYGFNRQWLEEGSGSVFPKHSPQGRLLDWAFELGLSHGYCDRDGRVKLKLHFVLFEGDGRWPIILFVGNGHYGWQIVDGEWYLDTLSLGGGGRVRQLEFYELLEELETASSWFDVSSSIFNHSKDFAHLWDGQLHPSWYLLQGKEAIGWTDDIIHAVEKEGSYQSWIEGHYKDKQPFFDTVTFIQKSLADESRSGFRQRIEAIRELGWWWPALLKKEKTQTDAEKNQARAGATAAVKPRSRIRRTPRPGRRPMF